MKVVIPFCHNVIKVVSTLKVRRYTLSGVFTSTMNENFFLWTDEYVTTLSFFIFIFPLSQTQT